MPMHFPRRVRGGASRLTLWSALTVALTGALPIALSATLVTPATLAAQQAADLIRGRVTGADGQPIAGAQVTAVSYYGGITKSTRTNREGRYSLTYPNGEGAYWLSFAAIGFQPQRIELKRVADEEVLVGDIKLSNTQTLQTVTTTASAARTPPPRTEQFQSDVSGADRYVSNGGIPPELAGNLAAMASAIPGVQLIPGVDGNPDRFSMFGLDPNQNNSTLNGQQAGLSSVPRDAAVSSQVRAGYDVANGGFSGAQVAVNTQSGNNYYARTLSSVMNAPQVQWNDPVGMASAYSSISFGGRMSGPITMDKDFYNVSVQFDQRAQRLPTLLSGTPLIFQSAGIAPDSVARLRSILGSRGIPASTNALGRTSPRTNASFLGAFDWAPKSPTSGHAFTLSLNGSYNDGGPQQLAATQSPSALSESRFVSGGAQLRHTNYFNNGILTESMFGATTNGTRNAPYVDQAGGSVLVTSTLPDGTTATRSLAFGGGLNAGSTSAQSLSGRNMLSWVTNDNKHRLKLITELRLDRSASERAFNLQGRYTYQSLADLQVGRPSSYSRSLNTVNQDGSALIGAIALGDAWRPTTTLQVQYGVRFDGNAFLDRPRENAAFIDAFGVSNARVPNRWFASPRVGFSWLYGTAPQISFGEGFFSGPRATIRGGIGMFQNVRGPELVSNAIAATGLPESQQQLTCTGAVTPLAPWDIAGGVSTQPGATCADGTTGSLFANNAPGVTMFAGNYQQERSLRSNVGWTGLALGNRVYLNANVQGMLNFHQPDVVDLNFRAGTPFALAREASRPVYVAPASIDPLSGLIATRDARQSQAFSSVSEQRSDLRSRSTQLTLSVSPYSFSSRSFTWSFTYNLFLASQQYRGFSNTAGDPFAIAWNTQAQPRHDVGYTLSYTLRNAVTLSWNGRLQSGQRFTPMVAGDVNGDGRANDRAFVFNSSDPTLGAAMQQLLANGSPAARSCLRAQVDRIADRNSCVGPWTTANTFLSLRFNPSKIRLPQRTSVTFTLSNPLAAADVMLNGESKLKGWGQPPTVDQSLLYVRGFDPSTRQFRYDVNQRFGATRVQQVTSRAPAVLTMQVGVNLAPTRDWQNLSQQLARGRTRAGTKMTEPSVRQMGSSLFPNVMSRLLQVGERIQLSRRQADSLATMSRRFTRLVDSAWTPAAKHLAALPKDYDRVDAERRLVAARMVIVDYLILAVPNVRKLLTKGQLRVLDSYILQQLEPRYLELLKSGQTGGEYFYF